jgi:hypothetical protein
MNEVQRRCGGCTLCCKLLPQVELKKPGGQRCQHQRMGQGCMIYARRPPSCRLWSCRWLVEDDTADLSRPDRSHYVIDIMPDFVTAVPGDGQERFYVQVVQVWIDPKYPDAHRDPQLRAYLARRGEENIAAIIRYGEVEAFVLSPPAMSGTGEFCEIRAGVSADRTHTLADVEKALGGKARIVVKAEA